MPTQIQVVIDRIVLDQPASHAERAALVRSVSEQLTALLAGTPARPPRDRTGRLGQQIAAGVHTALPVQQLGRAR